MSLKKAYLYLVSIISLVIMVIAGIMLFNMALKAWVFKKADLNYYSTPCYSAVATDGKQTPCSAEEQATQAKQQQEQRSAQRQSDAAQALAMLIVATPVWWYHWRAAKKEV